MTTLDEIINNIIQRITYLSITPNAGLRKKRHSMKIKRNKKNRKTFHRLK